MTLKSLSEAKREELFDIIKEQALDYGIGIVDNEEIDEYNILNATYMAMKKALNCLKKTARLFISRCSYNTRNRYKTKPNN